MSYFLIEKNENCMKSNENLKKNNRPCSLASYIKVGKSKYSDFFSSFRRAKLSLNRKNTFLKCYITYSDGLNCGGLKRAFSVLATSFVILTMDYLCIYHILSIHLFIINCRHKS